MKNIFFTASILCLISTALFSQTFYVKVGAGYAVGTSTGLLMPSTSATTTEGHYGSFGEGILPSLTAGYMFNNNIGIEVSGAYLIGKKFEHEHAEEFVTETHKMWGEGIYVNPSIVLQAPMKSHTYYIRFGGSLGMLKMKEEETETGDSARTGINKMESTGNIGFGINGAFGVQFKAGKMMNIFVEIFGTGMNYGPKQKENTETFSGGTLDPKLNYEESFPTSTANTELTPRLPFSNYGLALGITLNFGKPVKTKK